MIKTRANDLARLAQLEFALAPGGEELDHDFAAILFQNLAATRLGLTAGLNEITVFSGRVVKIFHQGQQGGLAPGRKVLADGAPATGGFGGWFGLVRHGFRG